ncbi:MAG: AraC family transcriptional regulator [Lentisphaeria bacterium]
MDDKISLPIFSQASKFEGIRNVKMHSHPGVELILITSGEGEIYLDGTMERVSGGSLIIVAPEIEHNQISIKKLTTFFVVFEVDPIFFNYSSRILDVSSEKWIKKWLVMICELSASMDSEFCDGIIYSLLKRIKYVEKMQKKAKHKIMHHALEKALAYIDENFAKPIDMDEISHMVGVSKSYLKALFIKELGIPPSKYIQNIRMGHAREILQNPYLYVEEVAAMCGYSDANYFSRAFRKIHECTPSEYKDFIKNRPSDNYKIRH